jgi:hypothetical protein
MATNGTSASPLAELDRLIKLMLLTQSPNDNEALAALRKANSWLRNAGADWEMILRGKVTVVADPFAGLDAPQASQTAYRPSTPTRPIPQAPPPRPQPAAAAYQAAQPAQQYAAAQAQAQASQRYSPQPAPQRRRKTTLADLGLA